MPGTLFCQLAITLFYKGKICDPFSNTKTIIAAVDHVVCVFLFHFFLFHQSFFKCSFQFHIPLNIFFICFLLLLLFFFKKKSISHLLPPFCLVFLWSCLPFKSILYWTFHVTPTFTFSLLLLYSIRHALFVICLFLFKIGNEKRGRKRRKINSNWVEENIGKVFAQFT